MAHDQQLHPAALFDASPAPDPAGAPAAPASRETMEEVPAPPPPLRELK